MSEFLAHPAFQGGLAPFLAALVVALVLRPVRLAGLAIAVAFVLSVYLAVGLQLTPLTALRKILVLALAVPLVGVAADFAFKPTRLGVALLALGAGGAALWVFWPALANKPAAQAWLAGGTVVATAVVVVGFSLAALASDAVRAGAAALALGIGVGAAAIIGATLTYGIYGAALGAGAGAFLLPQMISGRKAWAGATFTLPAMLLAALVGGGAVVLAELPWYCLGVLALVPVAARLPAPARAPAWLQAVLFSLYGFAVAGIACFFAWPKT
ncbi:MAG: hypothetical protein ACT4P4_18570 [Betaproteobacteria bacterium]